MKKLFILLCLLLIVVSSFFVAGYYVLFDSSFTDTYTSAVCSGNVCQDYEFVCFSGKIVSSRAISGFVTFREDWVDSRENKDKC